MGTTASTETSILGKGKGRGKLVARNDYADVAEVVGWPTEAEPLNTTHPFLLVEHR